MSDGDMVLIRSNKGNSRVAYHKPDPDNPNDAKCKMGKRAKVSQKSLEVAESIGLKLCDACAGKMGGDKMDGESLAGKLRRSDNPDEALSAAIGSGNDAHETTSRGE